MTTGLKLVNSAVQHTFWRRPKEPVNVELANNLISLTPRERKDLSVETQLTIHELADAWRCARADTEQRCAQMDSTADKVAQVLGGSANLGAIAWGSAITMSLSYQRRLERIEAMRPDINAIAMETL